MKNLILLYFLSFCSVVSASTYYVAPYGNDASGDGTIENPWYTLNKAWTIIVPGDLIYMRGGTYNYEKQILIGKKGTSENMIRIWAYSGEVPVLTKYGSYASTNWPRSIVRISGDYIHLKGLEICNNIQEDSEAYYGIINLDGNNNIYELLDIHHNGYTGLGIEYNSTGNLILNCDIHHNADPISKIIYGNADGIGLSHVPHGAINTIRGSRIWWNSDDGIDTYGSDSEFIIDNCWSWFNGYIPDTFTPAGDGNGFKLGKSASDWGNTIMMTVIRCIAYKNRTSGFHQNDANAAMALFNNTAYYNGAEGFWFGSNNKPHILKNNISYNNLSYCYLSLSSLVSNNTFLKNNTANPSFPITDADFLCLDGEQLNRQRDGGGNLPEIEFLYPAPGSELINSGIDVGLPFYGSSPDIGAFETVPPAPVVANQPPVVSISSPSKSDSFTSPASITVNATASDSDGAIIKVEFFQGNIKIGERTTAPFSITWTEAPEGTYSLTAVATDNVNSKTVSAAVSITVVEPVTPVNKMPIVSIDSPTKGSSFTAPATVTIDVNASDLDGSITKVELFNGAVKLYEKTAAPYSFTLKDLPAGSYELKAMATDNMKATSTSSSIDLTVSSNIELRDYFNLYPNPNDGRFTIDFTTLMEAEIFTLTIVDLIGKTIYREELSKDESTRQFDLSYLNSGIYVLMIASNQILLTQKIIKN